MWNNLFSSVNVLEKGVGATWLRNEVISNNIANIDTPGYKTSEVEFEDIMAAAVGSDSKGLKLSVTDQNHIPAKPGNITEVEAEVVKDGSSSAGLDENNVDIEHEMAELAKNSIEYYTLVSKLNSEFRKLDTAININ